jgi:polysaccharide chain length determinant protein (PEP-CTERM system associated)
MQEIVNQMLGEIRSAMRFRWYAMATAWIGCIIGWGVVSWLPDIYEGKARVFVDTSSVLQPLLKGQIVAPDVDAQITYVREALLGRETLEKVIRRVGLDTQIETTDERDQLITNLAARINIDSASATRRGPETVYSISFRSPNRANAVAVVDTVLTSFVEDTMGASREGEDTAQRFLDERVAEYEQRLEEAEQALADFKKENADRLPGAEGDYFARMQTERDALALAQRDLRILESKRKQLAQQLEGEGPVVPGALPAGEEPPPNSLDARIRDYQAQLDADLLVYTEKHPDVIAAREALARLTAQREEQLKTLGLDGADQELLALNSDPVYQALRISLNDTDVEIATLTADIAERNAKVRDLQGLIDEVPEVEAQLARLNRDYDVVYEQYLEIVRSREAQKLTEKASDADQVDFRIIDPPLASAIPVAPDRFLLIALVFFGSLGAGIALAYVCSQLWPVVGNVRTLRALVELPVLGSVTHAWSDRYRAEKRRAAMSYLGALLMLCMFFLGVLAVEVVGPGLHSLAS